MKKAKSLIPDKSPKFLLHRHLAGFDPARSLKTLHASELTKAEGFCPRFYALADRENFKGKDRWLSTSEAVTFQMGRDLERNVVGWFADMGKVVGHWSCVACGRLHQFQTRPFNCEGCGGTRFDHKEVRFVSAKNGASCGIDMLLALGDPKLRIVELKTMDKDQFKALKAPLAEHSWRSKLYPRIVAESDQPWASMVDTSRVTILYVSKGGYGCADEDVKKWGLSDKFSPFKEFEIKRCDAETDDLALRAQTVFDFRAGKIGMPHGICSTSMSKRAMSCPLKNACFSGNHPPQHHWQKEEQ